MIEKESNFISAVAYLQEDEDNVLNFLQTITEVLENNFKKYEVIFVSNYENKIAREKIKQFKGDNEHLNIRFILLDTQQGLEECMNAGVDMSIGDFVFEFDSCYIDYDKKLIMDIYRKSLEGYDIVVASPPTKYSKLSSKIFYSIYNRFSSNKNLSTERFRIISRRAINRVSGFNKTVPYRKAVYSSAGLPISEISYEVLDKKTGRKSEDVFRKEVAIDALLLFTNIAYRFALTFSILMALFMFGTGIYTTYVYFLGNRPVKGWSPLMGVISVGFLVIFIVLTVIIKYLDLLLRLIFKRQKYMVVNIEKF